MTAQPSLFDAAEGRRRRDLGMATAEAKADREWRSVFEFYVRAYAGQRKAFTADDIIAHVGMPPGNPNAIGALMRSLAMRGVIEDTGRVRKAKRPESHARRQTVWRGAV